jgi:hypothetical protein
MECVRQLHIDSRYGVVRGKPESAVLGADVEPLQLSEDTQLGRELDDEVALDGQLAQPGELGHLGRHAVEAVVAQVELLERGGQAPDAVGLQRRELVVGQPQALHVGPPRETARRQRCDLIVAEIEAAQSRHSDQVGQPQAFLRRHIAVHMNKVLLVVECYGMLHECCRNAYLA